MSSTPNRALAAPRDGPGASTIEFVAEMLAGAYAHGAEVEYFGYTLCMEGAETVLWKVYTDDGRFIEALNLSAFRTTTEVIGVLDEIVAVNPDDRQEWVVERRDCDGRRPV